MKSTAQSESEVANTMVSNIGIDGPLINNVSIVLPFYNYSSILQLPITVL